MKSLPDTNAVRFILVLAIMLLPFPGAAETSSETASTYSITLTPAPRRFGNVATGSSAIRNETASNPGGKRVILTGAGVTGTGFHIKSHPTYPYTLSAGTSVAFKLRFTPAATGTFTGSLTVHYKYLSNGTFHFTSRAVQLSGTGVTGALVPSPSALGFGNVQVALAKTLSESVTNSENTAITISGIQVTGAGYSFSGINPPVTLSSGQQATFQVKFKPQSSGTLTGKLTISSNASDPSLSVALSGDGIVPGQMGLSPSTVNFGNVVVGTTASQAGTVSAVNGPVTISAANVGGSEFSVSGLALPLTLSAGQSHSYKLSFAPSASGTASTTVTWLSNASNSPVSQSLNGTGTPPPQHSVTLNWIPSTSSNVVGYNVYRGTHSGGPYAQINTALDINTQDLDSNVQAGSTYYYVVTAVDSAGGESVYSNQAKAVIPYP